MRRLILLTAVLLLSCSCCLAQEVTAAVTVYREFQPATIWLADGKKLKVGLANIFLKNSSLLYKSGVDTKEANMRTLSRVEFKNRTYYRVDSVLVYQVDSVGSDVLYCAQRIDLAAWKQMVANNSQFTSLDLGDMVGFTTAELANEQDLRFPIVNVYYYRLDGKFVPVHERQLKRVLSKERQRLMESAMAEKGFSWTDEQSLLRLLRLIHRK